MHSAAASPASAVMTVVPWPTAVTRPVSSTVATWGSAERQKTFAPAGETVAANLQLSPGFTRVQSSRLSHIPSTGTSRQKMASSPKLSLRSASGIYRPVRTTPRLHHQVPAGRASSAASGSSQ